MADEAKRFPIDVRELKKGDFIPPEKIEEITGVKRNDSPLYALKMMALASEIEKLWHDEYGYFPTIKSEGPDKNRGLRVMTDAEASPYNEKIIKENIRSIHRRQRLLMNVDVVQLSTEEQLDHERRVRRGAYWVAALKDSRDKIRRLEHKRSWPEEADEDDGPEADAALSGDKPKPNGDSGGSTEA